MSNVLNTQNSNISEQSVIVSPKTYRNKSSVDFQNKINSMDNSQHTSRKVKKNMGSVDNDKVNNPDISQITNRYNKKKLDTRIDAVEMGNLTSYFSQAKVKLYDI